MRAYARRNRKVSMKIPSQSLLWGALLIGSAGAQAAATKIIDNGPDAGKKVIAVLGDGYNSSQQTRFNTDVANFITNGVFDNDFYKENSSAFNVYRVNLTSVDSTVSTRVYNENGTPTNPNDDIIVSTTMRNTPLKYIYSGSWAHCWVEPSAQSETLIQNALAANVPNADYVVIFLNNPNFGGCGGGGRLVLPRGVSWTTVAHEMGHGFGGLSDEYTGGGAYTGGSINGVNCTTDLTRTTIYWKRFVNPSTSLPTTFGAGMDANRTVGAFQGCATKDTQIYRPVSNCRMNSNTPNYCPVCYTHLKKILYPKLDQTFDKPYYGDFSGDGKEDVVLKHYHELLIYKSSGSAPYTMSLAGVHNHTIPAGAGGAVWTLRPDDNFYPGDFDNDGKTDLYVVSSLTASPNHRVGMLKSTGTGFQCIKVYTTTLGTWNLNPYDRAMVGDFNGDNKADLLLQAFISGNRVGMFTSSGTALTMVMNQSTSWPGWTMGGNDRFLLGDFDNDGKTDIYVQNYYDWGSSKYVGMLKSTGTNFSVIKVFTNSLPGWTMGSSDQLLVGDFDGDNKSDLYVWNGYDWGGTAYLAMMKSSGTNLSNIKEYWSPGNSAPGWTHTSGDRLYVADANKDGKDDLYVYNTSNWSIEYLAALISSGTALSANYVGDWVGGWNLGSGDIVDPVHYDGSTGNSGVYIHNSEWFGMIRYTNPGFTLDRLYYHWIYTALYDAAPWSDGFP